MYCRAGRAVDLSVDSTPDSPLVPKSVRHRPRHHERERKHGAQPTKAPRKRRSGAQETFDLGPLEGLDPALLLNPNGRDDLENLFLAFALIFNDLKSVLLGFDRIGHIETPNEATAQWGEVAGLHNHLHRYGAALMHELLNLIKEQDDLLRGERFAVIARRLHPKAIEGWKLLCTHAREETPEARMVMRIRHAGAFHYHQPKSLADGYRSVLFRDPKNELNKFAYISFGDNAEQTRFYFADAAGFGLMREIAAAENVPEFGKAVEAMMLLRKQCA